MWIYLHNTKRLCNKRTEDNIQLKTHDHNREYALEQTEISSKISRKKTHKKIIFTVCFV